jgi:rubrerythrin
MSNQSWRIEDVLNRAILNEQQSSLLYKQAVTAASSPESKLLLEALAEEETRHKQKLEEMKEKGDILQNDHMPKIISLGILDHVEEAPLSGEASYQEILIFAAHKEQEAHDYYAEMASKLGKTQAGGLFQRLAQEELGHKAKIEREYERTILKEG